MQSPLRTTLGLSLLAAVLGVGVGAAFAYVEVRLKPASRQPDQVKQIESSTDEGAQPRAEVPEMLFEFGSIEQNTSMSHVFAIENVGTAPLQVEVGDTTCKCTIGDLSEKVVQPGEATEVTLEWTAKTGLGPFRHGATLHTNDPRQSRIELIVEGKVVGSTALSPAELIFRTIRIGESKQAQLFLMAFIEPEVQVESFKVFGEQLAERIDVLIEPAEPSELPQADATSGVRVTATYQSDKTLGAFLGELKLYTNLEKAKVLTIPIVGNVAGDVSLYGPGWNPRQGLLRLGTIEGYVGKQVRLNMKVGGEHARATEYTIAQVDPPELQVSLGESREIREQLVHTPLFIEVPAGTAPMVRIGGVVGDEGLIVLHSTHPNTAEVKLRVQFTVR